MTTKLEEYRAIQNPVQAARFLERHRAEIYPTPAPAAAATPEPASIDDVAHGRVYLELDKENPAVAASFMSRRQVQIVRGLEAIRGRRPMPPPPTDDPNTPPPPAAA